jgi:cytochrome c-type biogenesis protein CcmH/NrfG
MKEKKTTFRLAISNILPYFIVVALFLKPQSEMVSKIWEKINLAKTTRQSDLLEENYIALLSQQPWQKDIYSELAQIQNEKQNFSGVVDSLEKLSTFGPLKFSEEFLLAEAYIQNGNSEKALELWEDISSRSNLKTEEYFQVFDLQEKNRDWDGAYRTIQLLSEKESQDSEIQYRLALYQMIFNPEQANISLLQSLQGHPSWAERIKNLQSLTNLINSEENPTFRWVLAGNGLANQGEWLLASAAFEKVTQADPNYAEGWALYGNALSYIDLDGFKELKKAEEISPDSKITRAFLAVYYRNHGDLGTSKKYLEGLSKEEPDEAFWQYEMANTHAKNGDLNIALASYKKAIEMDPKNSFYWKELANFCLDYSFLIESEGIEAARQAMLLNNEDSDAFDIMGSIYLKMNNYVNAERFFIEANQLSPYSSKTLLHLGQLYYLKNEKNLAFFYLTNAVDYTQNETIKDMALKLLEEIN